MNAISSKLYIVQTLLAMSVVLTAPLVATGSLDNGVDSLKVKL